MSKKEEFPLLKGTIELPYSWAIGPAAAKFFDEFKKNKRIMGTQCSTCNRILVPARAFCPRCFTDTEEWIQVSDEGTLRTFCITYYSFPGQPTEPPYAVGIIELDGADTGITHYIGGVDLTDVKEATKKIKVGIRVKAIWKDNREGTIHDIKYFKPVE